MLNTLQQFPLTYNDQQGILDSLMSRLNTLQQQLSVLQQKIINKQGEN